MKKFPAVNSGRRGVSMLEAVVSLFIMLLLGGAFIALYTSMITTGGRVTALSYTAWDAANAVDRITLALREARRFEFMDNGTTGPAQYQSSSTGNNTNYLATNSSGTVIAVTGIHIVYPAANTSVSLNIPSGSGVASTSMTGSKSLADYRTDGSYLDVYRSDKNGHPAPSNGTYLWMRGTINGATIGTDSNADTSKGIDGRPLIRDIAPWDGSVQFVQGQTNEVQVKIVTGAYDRINNQLTSDSTKGAVTSLTADHVYLRNHDPNGVSAGSSHGTTQYAGS